MMEGVDFVVSPTWVTTTPCFAATFPSHDIMRSDGDYLSLYGIINIM